MEALIKKVEQIPVSLGNLKKFSPPHVHCMLYTDITDKLFIDGKPCTIILLENDQSSIGHFVLLIKRDSSVEYWSSYGNKPDFAIKKTGNDRRLLKL